MRRSVLALFAFVLAGGDARAQRAALPFSAALPASAVPLLAIRAAPVFPGASLPAVGRSYGSLQSFFDGGIGAGTPGVPVRAAAAGVDFNGREFPHQVFSDQARISEEIIAAIDASRESIDLALHGLALSEFMDALSRAKERGVRVRLVMNRHHVYPEKPGQRRSREVQRLIDEGFELRTLRGGDAHGAMHNKFALFDGKLLETGSYNWARAADRSHFENALFIDHAHRLEGYREMWKWMWEQSKPLGDQAPSGPRGTPPADPARPVSFRGETLPAYAFSPKGGAEAWLLRAVDAARESIDIAMFSFTSPDLRAALLRAKERGVRVRLVFDRAQFGQLEEMRWFVEQGFDLRLSNGLDGERGVQHNKFAVFDGLLLETGS